MALVQLPPEEDDKVEAAKSLAQDALNRDLLLNVEYKYDSLRFISFQMQIILGKTIKLILFIFKKKIHRVNGQPYATLTDPATSTDVGRALIADGILLVDKRREKKLKSLVNFLDAIIFVHIILEIGVDEEAKLESLVTGCGKSTLLCQCF